MTMQQTSDSDLGKRGVGTFGDISPARWGDCGKADRPSSSSCYCFNINIATWNVRGLNQPVKLTNVIQEMEELNVDILGIAETFWKEAGEFDTSILTSDNKYRVIFSG